MGVVVRAPPASMHRRTVRVPGFTLTSGVHDPRAMLLASLARIGASAGRGAHPKWLTEAMDIVHERFTGQLSLSELSTLVGVHPVTLARWFRRGYGCTVGQQLRRLRIEKSSRDLLETDRPLGEIALNAGFADQSHFCNVFRREMNTTPGRYRASRR
ncbi:MAG: helix-turn-helix transcriptional regulator [Gemmatimonadaceae bacterium]